LGNRSLGNLFHDVPEDHEANAGNQEKQLDSGLPHLGLSLAPAVEVAGSGGEGVIASVEL